MAWLDNFEGVPHADRDGSESVQPLGSAGLSEQGGYSVTHCPTKAALSEVVYGDVRHHRERIEQLKDWVRQWKAKADTTERRLEGQSAEVTRLRGELTEAYVLVGDLSAKLKDKDDMLAKVAEYAEYWRKYEPLSKNAWGEGFGVAIHVAGNHLYNLKGRT